MDKLDINTKKLFITLFFILAFTLVLCAIFCMYLSSIYKNSIYEFCNNVVYNISKEYPNVESDVIKNFLENAASNEDSGNILKEYGIDSDNIDLYLNSKSVSNTYILLFGILVVVFITLNIIVLFIYLKKQNSKVNKLSGYIDEILKSNYLDIRDNDEGSLSILKNKIYDMMVVLKNKSDLLVEDKVNLEKLFADISHQIKTPLTSLNILNELLYDDDLPKEKKNEFLDAMLKELKKVEWLVTNILNISKLDAGNLSLNIEPSNLLDVLNKSKDNISVFAEIMQVNISISKLDKDVYINVDSKWFSEAINNLLKNAIEHKSKNIVITYEENNIYTKIDIKDDGEGIDKEDLPYVFDRFYKAKNSKKDSVGLGLAFTKSIIKAQNGEISVRSKRGKGTEFEIRIYSKYI